MKFDFSSYPIRNRGFSERLMTILDPEPRALLMGIMEIALIETGSRKARENWQDAQLRNLLRHAAQHSAFWQKRIRGKKPSLRSLPVLTRQELLKQVALEGALLRREDGLKTKIHATSGSSGTPVRFFVSEWNVRYNDVRAAAQFFIEGRDFSPNVTLLRPGDKAGFSVKKIPSWMGSLAPLIRAGAYKYVEYLNPNMRDLIEELRKDDIGYLVCDPRLMEVIFSSHDPIILKETKTAMWFPVSEHVDQDLRRTFSDLSIPIRSSYSSEEAGPIGYECESFPEHYHVATSNVIVDVVDQSHDVDGTRLGKVLVTHLHSYATPLIRYDLGDLACLRPNCPCGHPAPTIYNLHGRLSKVIKHRDGRKSAFHVRGLSRCAQHSEFRIRQTDYEKLVVEIGGRSSLSTDEIAAVTILLRNLAGNHFQIEVIARDKINWGESRKRHEFRCEVVDNRG